MSITATNTGGAQRELVPAGNFIARCYKMIQIGLVEEIYMGEKKMMNKVRIAWEMPLETKVFKEEKGPQPLVIEKEYTLSMAETANLRKMLASWRGKDFTEDEAKAFDITKLIGVPCMLNIIHKPNKEETKMYEQISSVSPMPKGVTCPPQVNPTFVLSYDDWSEEKFKSLPDFIKNKMVTSAEYKAMKNPTHNDVSGQDFQVQDDPNEEPLPF